MSRTVSAERDPAAARSALERTIAAGGVALFPSDGLYGLACDPLREGSIARIHKIKGRDDGKPSAVLYFSPLAMREVVSSLGPQTREALAALLPGPVTAVVHNSEHRYPLACREDPERLGLRLIEGPLAGAMCPILQTSANLTGERPPASFAEVDRSIREAVDLGIDGGELEGQPSTVVDLCGLERRSRAAAERQGWRILREGALGANEVAELLAGL
jgi:L-threonylcarbamoyladenylate synthase